MRMHNNPMGELENLRGMLPHAQRAIHETREGSIARSFAVTDLAALRESIRTLEAITKEAKP